MSYFVEAIWMQAYDALDVARVERRRAEVCRRAADRYQRRGMASSESRELRDCLYHQNRADLALLEALQHRAKAKALRRVVVAELAKTEPPPPSDVCMVAGE